MTKENLKAIKAGKLIDGTGAAPLEDVTVLIENDKIKALGKDVKIPQGVEVIDASGKTVMPGMIDAHVHFYGMKAEDTDIDFYTRPREVRSIKAAFDAKKRLASGFTMNKECGGMYGIYIREAAAENFVSGIPRIISAGYALENTQVNPHAYMPPEFIDVRHTQFTGQIGGEVLICDGVEECIKAARYSMSRGTDFIKLMARGDVCFNQDELNAIVKTAAQAGKYVTVHCDSAEYAKSAIRAGVKTIDHAVAMDEEAVEMGNKAGVIFVSTLTVMQGVIDYGAGEKRIQHGAEWAKGMLEKMRQGYENVRKLGGIMAIGTDMGGENLLENLDSSAYELELLVRYCDFTPMEAIVAATKNGALACFMGDRTGTIEAGKLADIIVVDGDPLADIKILQEVDRIKLVMLEGKIEVNKED